MLFFLGTHKAHWLGLTAVPLCISRRTLASRRSLPRAKGPWMLDSGGFTELSSYGGWVTNAKTYIAEVRRFKDEIGNLLFAAPQDWMCEPAMLKRTGLTVNEHQIRTVDSFLELKSLDPTLPIFPVLQGWEPEDYARHVEMYDRAGVDLGKEPVVGVGTVCRRQHTAAISSVIGAVMFAGVTRLHGFGVKQLGLERIGHLLTSADSLAWSYAARAEKIRLPGHPHATCSNCIDFALQWREKLLRTLDAVPPRQLVLS